MKPSPETLLEELQQKLDRMGVTAFNAALSKANPYPAGKMYFVKKKRWGKILYYPVCEKSLALRGIIWLHNFRTTFSEDTLKHLQGLGFEAVIEDETTTV